MKTVLVDASSAILLYKVDLVDLVADRYRFCIVPSVFREVTVDHRPGSDAFRNMADAGKLVVLEAVAGAPSDPSLPAGLHRGERDTLARFLTGRGTFLLVDDGRAAAVCRQMDLPYTCALLVPQIGYHCGLLSAEIRDRRLQALEEIGRYSLEVIHFARNCTHRQVAAFLP